MSSAAYATEELVLEAPKGGGEGQLLEISMGPQHPSTHGVFRMNVVLDGERVMKLKPDLRSACGISVAARSETKPAAISSAAIVLARSNLIRR